MFWTQCNTVLNAFRHQRSSDEAFALDLFDSEKCSTPFGIKEVRTEELSEVFPLPLCAQRLSASKKFGL